MGTGITMTTTELQEFWETKNYKIYVVRLKHPKGRIKPEEKYVRVKAQSNTREARVRAARVAVDNSVDFSRGKPLDIYVRLAHPERDLGCVRSEPAMSEAA